MARIFRDDEASLAPLEGRAVGIIGYGNQGRAQALNLRDSGIAVTVGNIDDPYRERAVEDGFDPVPIAEAANACDLLLILIPDEVQPEVYARDIAPGLRDGDALVFASGYNIHYRLVEPPPGIDVAMVAPRMIGEAVRDLFVRGSGYPCLVGVDRDATGTAWDVALAVARGIGATRLGAFESSFREETLIDLFAEQMLWPGINQLCLLYYEKLVEKGCDPDIVATELHLSGEFVEIARAMIREGFLRQLKLHSHTSQYGQLSRGPRMAPEPVRKAADKALEEIESGAFAREWTREQEEGLPELSRLWKQAEAHPINAAENRLSDLRAIVARADET